MHLGSNIVSPLSPMIDLFVLDLETEMDVATWMPCFSQGVLFKLTYLSGCFKDELVESFCCWLVKVESVLFKPLRPRIKYTPCC